MPPRPINALAAALVLAQGCATAPLPAPDMTADWRIQHGQAVWTPAQAKDGIAGELLVATNSYGDFVVEFSKPPINIATAQRTDSRWQATFPAENKRYAGAGAGPSRLIWLHLVPALQGRDKNWSFTTNQSGWLLERKGETLEGFLQP